MNNLTSLKTWQNLQAHSERIKNLNLKTEFSQNPSRVDQLSLKYPELAIYFDFSKNLITEETLNLLLDLARECEVEKHINAMFSGEHINFTENRAVLHTALRNPNLDTERIVDGEDINKLIKSELDHVEAFANKVFKSEYLGYTGKPIDTLVNIGIGGSHLGIEMLAQALSYYKNPKLKIYFVSNIDEANLNDVLSQINPETTLFFVASKTFTTQETIYNAQKAKQWFLAQAKEYNHISRHFVALSTNVSEVEKFGIAKENIFAFWDFVGGRYSIWSAIGLSIACLVGFENFRELLNGANLIDEHLQNTPLNKNLPVLLALLGIWYNNFLNMGTQAVIPYSHYLKRFPAYLQQAEMESNGKSVTIDNKFIEDYQTSTVVFGEPGTDSQHAFFQLFHQGTKVIPIDFIGFKKPLVDSDKEQHDLFMANMIAQAEALMVGKTAEQVGLEMENNFSPEEIQIILNHKVMPGNRPSTTLLFDKLTPASVGKLIALYEHKIFIQGAIWGINSFDQWGVELGKQLAKNIQKELATNQIGEHDASTRKLMEEYRK